ncbi:MAG: DUF305 domain-containing protein [Alphaproteobacteria bacterium]|nr:DUF305 domain-containing protein [Alphaproteobacteria bacterium]
MKFAASVALTACLLIAQPASAHNTSHESSPDAANAPYDLQFLDTMIVHHKEAIHMAQQVSSSTEQPLLLKMAEDILNSQQGEIADMITYRDEHFRGAKPAVNMHFVGMHESMAAMNHKALETAKGTAYDREFIRQMIPHHEGALVMCRDASMRAQLKEIRDLCERIVPAQTKEIAEMKALKEELDKQP